MSHSLQANPRHAGKPSQTQLRLVSTLHGSPGGAAWAQAQAQARPAFSSPAQPFCTDPTGCVPGPSPQPHSSRTHNQRPWAELCCLLCSRPRDSCGLRTTEACGLCSPARHTQTLQGLRAVTACPQEGWAPAVTLTPSLPKSPLQAGAHCACCPPVSSQGLPGTPCEGPPPIHRWGNRGSFPPHALNTVAPRNSPSRCPCPAPVGRTTSHCLSQGHCKHFCL